MAMMMTVFSLVMHQNVWRLAPSGLLGDLIRECHLQRYGRVGDTGMRPTFMSEMIC